MARVGHRECAAYIILTVVRFVLDRIASGLARQAFVHAAALDHEIRYDAVKYSIAEVSVSDVLPEIFTGYWRLFFKQFDVDIAVVGLNRDHVGSLWVWLM